MKTKLTYLSLAVLLVGCGGGGGGNNFETNNSDLEGFWGATHVNSQAIQSDSMYFLFEDVSSSSIQAATFTLQANSNCFNKNSGRLKRIEENEYEDSAGDAATITLQNNVLTFIVDDISVAAQPVVETSSQDLPLCL